MAYKSKVATCSDEEFSKVVAESYSYKEALSKLGYNHSGGAYFTFRKRLKKLNLSTEHMTSKKRFGRNNVQIPDDKIFIKDSPYRGSLRGRVLRDKKVPYVCAICGQPPEWNRKPLTLTLDHINGDHFDNRLENLRFVCPNCDTQQDTYGGRNTKKYGKEAEPKKEPSYKCTECGAPVWKKGQKCKKCAAKLNVKNSITKEEFLEELKSFSSFTEMGRRFGLSDNAIRKWCRNWGLPTSTASMKHYIERLL